MCAIPDERRSLSRKPVANPVAADRQETPAEGAWTCRRFLGALGLSAVAVGVKIPRLPAADAVEAVLDLGGPDKAVDYFIVVHPSWYRSLATAATSPMPLTWKSRPRRALYEGVRIVEGEALEATLADLPDGKLVPSPEPPPIAIPRPAPWREI